MKPQKIPVYVVTGFLDAGKTTLLNRMLNHRALRNVNMLLVQFESGEEEFATRYSNRQTLRFNKRALEKEPEQIVGQLVKTLRQSPVSEIWIEWNGMATFSQLQALLLHPALYPLCRLRRAVHVLDVRTLDDLLGRTGAAMPEQMASCDLAVLRGAAAGDDFERIRDLLRGLNAGVKLFRNDQVDDILTEVYNEYVNPVDGFAFCMVAVIAFFLVAKVALAFMQSYFPDLSLVQSFAQSPVNTLVVVFLGIVLQALPFLLIGVLLSSGIQVLLPQGFIERRFPKKFGWGIVAAVLGGFCLPVCDCASIPIFKSLVRKGVPISAAVTFLTATPVINPVVMLSTYYAFGGNLRFVATRVGLGLLSAVLIGLIYQFFPGRKEALTRSFDSLTCNCGCYESAQTATTWSARLGVFLRHSQTEFFNVGKYLMIGAFVASLFQVTLTKSLNLQNSIDYAIALLIMMGLAYLLCVCSTSDAVVARSFAISFPASAVMGFLVFGPMLDIKNVLMLSGSFSMRFILRLLAVVFAVCYAVVFLLARPALGG